ncbi:hypothetical protein [Rosistilla ulvae]|nr:hypothetical protein [Rosistilla ulvae]
MDFVVVAGFRQPPRASSSLQPLSVGSIPEVLGLSSERFKAK